MSAFEDALDAYAAIRSAGKQIAALAVGDEDVAIDIPDIDVTYRVKGKTVKAKITALIVERVS